MNLRAAIEDQQVRWAMRKGISLGGTAQPSYEQGSEICPKTRRQSL
jgi:hypothetical protein